ncbi:hypothetical protein HJC23_000624 [Cyclotella cryptica]|uniref:Uncharacterized protein n=1 Tax=Cyclotella cryptica TaxID=29204 RepID=A0ABD3Q848_9STRA|eukprot:CCRYP_008012-RA/>CCRYP_008012-RA protein AED:0.04 eAED:0.04 QI:285/1/1/1/1/1/2/329/210
MNNTISHSMSNLSLRSRPTTEPSPTEPLSMTAMAAMASAASQYAPDAIAPLQLKPTPTHQETTLFSWSHQLPDIASKANDGTASFSEASRTIIIQRNLVMKTASVEPPPKPMDPLKLHAERNRICNEIRGIIIRRIPEEKRNSYTPRQINRQAMFFEAFLFKNKLKYELYRDLNTLEERVMRVVRMTLTPRLRGYSRMPNLIVEMDLDMK